MNKYKSTIVSGFSLFLLIVAVGISCRNGNNKKTNDDTSAAMLKDNRNPSVDTIILYDSIHVDIINNSINVIGKIRPYTNVIYTTNVDRYKNAFIEIFPSESKVQMDIINIISPNGDVQRINKMKTKIPIKEKGIYQIIIGNSRLGSQAWSTNYEMRVQFH